MPREKKFDEETVVRELTQVFWQKGYTACSVGDLVAASGLSRSSLYDTFGDKEQLFMRCFTYYGVQMKARLGQITEDKPTAIAKIEAALLSPFAAQNTINCKGCLAVNTMGEFDGKSGPIQEMILNTRAVWVDFLTQCIRDGQQKNQITKAHEPAVLAGLLYTILCGVFVLQKAMPDLDQHKSQIHTILQLLKQP